MSHSVQVVSKRSRCNDSHAYSVSTDDQDVAVRLLTAIDESSWCRTDVNGDRQNRLSPEDFERTVASVFEDDYLEIRFYRNGRYTMSNYSRLSLDETIYNDIDIIAPETFIEAAELLYLAAVKI